MVGGLAFLIVLARWFDHFQMLYFAALLNLLLAAWAATLAGKRGLAAMAIAISIALCGVVARYDLDDISRRLELAGQQVVFHRTSPYGSLVVTQGAGQLNFIESGVPLFSTHNLAQIEESVHYAMAQRPNARRVLLVSGGASGTAREVLKYPVQAVDYVELDPLIVDAVRKFLPDSLADPRIHVMGGDGRLLVRHTARRYDVVIVEVPDPSTSQLNRFYTREFFAEVRRILAADGVLSFSLGTYENYLGKELARLIGVAHRTLGAVYARVLMLPGQRVFFLASDGPLTADVAPRMEAAGVSARLVNRNYLKGMLTADRLADLRRAVSAEPLERRLQPDSLLLPSPLLDQPVPGPRGNFRLSSGCAAAGLHDPLAARSAGGVLRRVCRVGLGSSAVVGLPGPLWIAVLPSGIDYYGLHAGAGDRCGAGRPLAGRLDSAAFAATCRGRGHFFRMSAAGTAGTGTPGRAGRTDGADDRDSAAHAAAGGAGGDGVSAGRPG